MSLLTTFVKTAIDPKRAAPLAKAARYARVAKSATARAAKDIHGYATGQGAQRVAKAATKRAADMKDQAARIGRSSARWSSFDRNVVDPVMRPVAKVARGAGSVAIGAGRIAGAGANVVAKHPRAWGVGLAGAGAVAGVGSGLRDSARSVNSAMGDPVGSYASMSVKTAFMGNPSNSRSKRGGASGNITLNSR